MEEHSWGYLRKLRDEKEAENDNEKSGGPVRPHLPLEADVGAEDLSRAGLGSLQLVVETGHLIPRLSLSSRELHQGPATQNISSKNWEAFSLVLKLPASILLTDLTLLIFKSTASLDQFSGKKVTVDSWQSM